MSPKISDTKIKSQKKLLIVKDRECKDNVLLLLIEERWKKNIDANKKCKT